MAKKVKITGKNLLNSIEDDWGGKNETSEAIDVYGTQVPAGQEWGMNRGEVERFVKEKLQEHDEGIETLGEEAIGDVEEGPFNPVTNRKPIYFYKVDDPGHEHPITIEVSGQVGGEEKIPRVSVLLNTPGTIKKGDTIDFDWVYDFIHKIDGEEQTGGLRPTPSSVAIEVKAGNTLIYSDTINGGVVEDQHYNVRFANPNATGQVTITVVATVIIDGQIVEAIGGEVVTIVEMRLSTDFNPARSLSAGGIAPRDVSVACAYRVPSGSVLYVWLDGVLFDNPSIGTNSTYFFGDRNINDGNGLAAGRHNLQFVARNGTLLSNLLIVDFLVSGSDSDYLGIRYSCDVDALESLPLNHLYGETAYPATVERFSDLQLLYAAWNVASPESNVKVYVCEQTGDEEPVSTLAQDLNVDRTAQTLRQRFDDTTQKGLVLAMGTASIGFDVSVTAASELDISIAANPYEELLADGKSNSQSDREDWGGITTFEGVNWNTNGWVTDSEGITSLLLTNGARAVIGMKPFAAGENSPQQAGMAFQMKFKVSHVTQRGATVISCLSENQGNEGWPTGFRVTAAEAGLLFGGKEEISTTEKKTYNGIHNGVEMETYIDGNGVEVHIGDFLDDNDNWVPESQAAVLKIEKPYGVTMDIATDKWVDLMLVVYTPAQVDAMFEGQDIITSQGEYGIAMLYLNGVLSRVNRYSKNKVITQESPVAITIDSDHANVNVRLIRWYTRFLKADETLNNWILGLDTQGDMVTAYNRNAVGDGQTADADQNIAISIESLGAKRKGRLTFVKSSADYGGGATGIEELFADGVGKSTNFHADLVRWEPPQDENGTPVGEGFEARNVRIRIQGTSSVNYPYKNIRVYLTTPFSKNAGCSLKIGSTLYTYDPGSGKLKDSQGKTCQGYCIRGAEKSRPQTVLCAKTDFVDSSLALNTGGAHLFNDVMVALGLRTPPMEHDDRVRQAIDGIPCDVFAATSESEAPSYFGQFVLNNEKSKSGKIFGMEGNDESVFVPTCPIALESLENKYAFTLFQAAGSADSPELEAQMMDSFDDAFEFNYPEDVFYNEQKAIASLGNDYDPDKNLATAQQRTAIKRLMGFIHDSVAASEVDMNEPQYGGHGEWASADKQKWASQYFKDHAAEYFDVNYLLIYYIITDYWASVDQRAKNILWRTWDGMKWYPTYYDGDTAMGVRNDAFLVYKYDVTRDFWDTERGKYAFEGHDSWLWCLVLANYEEEMTLLADSLRRGGYMSNTEMLREFNEVMMGNWSERQYNKSGKLKYVDTMFKSTKYFPFTLQGNKELHRTQFITERAALLDARYNTENYRGDIMTLRINRAANDAPDSLTIVSGDLYYYGWRENNTTKLRPVRVNNGETYQMMFAQAINAGSSYVAVMGASKIKELYLTGLGNHLVTELQLGNCTMLTKLVARADNGIALNVNMTLGGMDTLEHIDLTGQTSLYTGSSGLLNVSGQGRLRTLLAGNTNFTIVNLPEGAPLSELVLPPTLTTLTLRYLPQLTHSGLTIQGYGSITGFNFAECPDIDWKDILDRCQNLQRVRVEGVSGKVDPAWLTELKNRNVKGYDRNGNPVEYPCLVGSVMLSKVIADEDLAALRSHFQQGGLVIAECQYSVYEIDDTLAYDGVLTSACVKNLENGSMATDATGEGYVPTGHAVLVRNRMKPVWGGTNQNGEWVGEEISGSDYKRLADGNEYDHADILNAGKDAMMLLPHCWYKGVNDFIHQKKYIIWSSIENGDGIPPQSSARHCVIKKLSETEDEAQMLVRLSAGVNVGYIEPGVSGIATDGVIDSSDAAATYNVYKIDIEGMRQVRWPGINDATYGACFLDADGVVISKHNMAVNGGDFDFQADECDYLYLPVPTGAKHFVFTTRAANTSDPRSLVVAVDSDEVEAIEPDWVEHKECLVGLYHASVDGNNRIRSLTGKTVTKGTTTQEGSTSPNWTYDENGDPTNASVPSNLKYSMKDLQNLSRRRGKGYQLQDYEMTKFVAILFYCLTGTLDSQSVCGAGRSYSLTGTRDEIGNRSTTNLEFSSSAGKTNKCLGLESWFGCIADFVDNVGVNVTGYVDFYKSQMANAGEVNGRWWIYDPDEEEERYVKGVAVNISNSYVKRVRHGRHCDIVPSIVGGTSTSRYADTYSYNPVPNRVLVRSDANGGATGGIAYATATFSSSIAIGYCGTRLAFRGRIKLSNE